MSFGSEISWLGEKNSVIAQDTRLPLSLSAENLAISIIRMSSNALESKLRERGVAPVDRKLIMALYCNCS